MRTPAEPRRAATPPPQAAADEGQESLRQQRPRPNRNRSSSSAEATDESSPFRRAGRPVRRNAARYAGRPRSYPGSDRVPDRVVGQPTLRVRLPRTVQSGTPPGCSACRRAPAGGGRMVVAPPAAHLVQRQQDHPARSTCSSSAWLPGQPVTASHSSPPAAPAPRSPAELTPPAGGPIEHLFAQVVQDVAVAAVNAAAELSTSPVRAATGRPAGPAAQPSVHAASAAATASGSGASPRFAGRSRDLLPPRHRLPGREAQFRGAQPVSCQPARSRARASGGSLRLVSARCSPGGRCSSRNPATRAPSPS